MHTSFEFDGTKCKIRPRDGKLMVEVLEGGLELWLETVDGRDLYERACKQFADQIKIEREQPRAGALDPQFVRQCKRESLWRIDRVCYMFSLAARRIIADSVRR